MVNSLVVAQLVFIPATMSDNTIRRLWEVHAPPHYAEIKKVTIKVDE